MKFSDLTSEQRMEKLKTMFTETSCRGKALSPENWYGTDYVGDRMCDSSNVKLRIQIAREGYGLDKLINDSSPLVRVEVAKHYYRPDLLINDSSPLVRRVLAESGYANKRFIKDSDSSVRSAALEASKVFG